MYKFVTIGMHFNPWWDDPMRSMIQVIVDLYSEANLRVATMALGCALLVGCSAEVPDREPVEASKHDVPTIEDAPIPVPQIEAAIAELESWSMVIEVMHDDSLATDWLVGVIDDGSPKFGLAESVCMELDARNLENSGTWVRIVDRYKVISSGGDFRAASLGSVMCESGQWMMP